MNRYSGNRGIIERIPEPGHGGAGLGVPHRGEPRATMPEVEYTAPVYRAPANKAPAHSASPFGGLSSLGGLFSGGKKPPEESLLGSLGGSLGGLFSKFTLESLEMEDYLLLGMLYLLYRDSGDIEFLLIAGAMLLL